MNTISITSINVRSIFAPSVKRDFLGKLFCISRHCAYTCVNRAEMVKLLRGGPLVASYEKGPDPYVRAYHFFG